MTPERPVTPAALAEATIEEFLNEVPGEEDNPLVGKTLDRKESQRRQAEVDRAWARIERVTTDTVPGAPPLKQRVRIHWVVVLTIGIGEPPRPGSPHPGVQLLRHGFRRLRAAPVSRRPIPGAPARAGSAPRRSRMPAARRPAWLSSAPLVR